MVIIRICLIFLNMRLIQPLLFEMYFCLWKEVKRIEIRDFNSKIGLLFNSGVGGVYLKTESIKCIYEVPRYRYAVGRQTG